MWLTLGTITARALALIGVMAVARLLDKETFGQFSIIQSSIVTAAVFAGLGLGSTVTRHIAQMRDSDIPSLNRLMTMTDRLALASGIIFSALLIGGAPYVAREILNSPQLAVLLAVGSASVLFNILFGYFNAALVGFEAIKQSALAQVLASAISVPALIALTHSFALNGAIAGLVIQAALLGCVSFLFYLKQRQKWGLRKDSKIGSKEYNVLWTYALPAFAFNLMVMPAHWVCHSILVRSSGGSSEMATTGVVMQWYFALLFLPSIAGRVLFPTLSALSNSHNQKDTFAFLRFSFLSNALVSIPFAVLIALMGPLIMGLYGYQYVNDWPVLGFVVAASAVATLAIPFNIYLVASGRVWSATTVNLIWALIYMCLSYIWVGQGAIGLAKAILVAHAVRFALIIPISWRASQK